MKTPNPHDELIDSPDILIAHNPAKGFVDNDGGRQHGCESSAAMVRKVLPRLYVCGHIHFGRGVENVGSVQFVNGSNVTEKKGAQKETDQNNREVEDRSYDILDDGRPIVVRI